MRSLGDIRTRHAVLAVALAAGAAYAGTLGHEFTWDDGYNVVENRAIRDLANVPGFFTEAWGAAAADPMSRGINTNYWRPVALASYALDHALFGLEPAGFHATNVLLHVFASVLVLLLGLRLAPSPSLRSGSPPSFGGFAPSPSLRSGSPPSFGGFAPSPSLRSGSPPSFGGVLPAPGPTRAGSTPIGVLLGALLFAVHPVHTEAVDVVTYRTDLLASVFYAAALVLWLGHGRLVPWVWAPLLYAAGVASKEMAVTLPLSLLLLDLLLPPRPLTLSERALRLAPTAAVGAGYLALRAALLEPSTLSYFGDAPGPVVAATMLEVLLLYARLLVVPWPLNPFYDWSVLPPREGFLAPGPLAGLALLALWIAAVAVLWRRRPPLAFLLAFFLVALLPVSQLVPVVVAAGERFLYLASAGPLLAAAVLAAERFPRAVLPAGAAVLVAFGALTVVRNQDWRNDRTILEANVRDWPESWNAWYGLARIEERDGRLDRAIRIYEKLGRPADAERARLSVPRPDATKRR